MERSLLRRCQLSSARPPVGSVAVRLSDIGSASSRDAGPNGICCRRKAPEVPTAGAGAQEGAAGDIRHVNFPSGCVEHTRQGDSARRFSDRNRLGHGAPLRVRCGKCRPEVGASGQGTATIGTRCADQLTAETKREVTMNQDKRLWYAVAAVIVVLLVIAYAAGWFGGQPRQRRSRNVLLTKAAPPVCRRGSIRRQSRAASVLISRGAETASPCGRYTAALRWRSRSAVEAHLWQMIHYRATGRLYGSQCSPSRWPRSLLLVCSSGLTQ